MTRRGWFASLLAPIAERFTPKPEPFEFWLDEPFIRHLDNAIFSYSNYQCEPGAESPVTAPRVRTVPEDLTTGDAALQQSSPATNPVDNGNLADNGQAVA